VRLRVLYGGENAYYADIAIYEKYEHFGQNIRLLIYPAGYLPVQAPLVYISYLFFRNNFVKAERFKEEKR
jgi:hypothetical protein